MSEICNSPYGAPTVFLFYSKFLPRFMRLALSYNFINALAKNSPQDCFLNARLQVPSSLAGKIKEQPTQVLVVLLWCE